LRVVLSNVDAVNDSVVRVDCFTYEGDIADPVNDSYRYYQLAIGVDTFTEKGEDGSVGILGDKFQEAVTAKILQTRNVAELAYIINGLQLEWDVNVTAANDKDEETPKSVEGMKLAQA